MQKWMLPLNIGLAVLVIALLALIGSDIAAYRLAKTFPLSGAKRGVSVPSLPAASEDLMAFAPILEKGLFGKATQGKLFPVTAAPATAKAAAPTVSQGDLVLLGTAVGSFRETFALIQKTSSKEERVFRLGDSVFDLGPLVAVKKEVVEVLSGGKRVKILSPSAVAAEASAPAAAPPLPPLTNPGGGLATQTGSGSFVIDQRALNASLDNIGQAMTDARLLPSMKDGKVEGFRASEVKPGGIFGMVGIRNGDVLKSINDFPIDSPEKAIQSFVSLKGQSRIKLDLIRDGQPVTFTYDIR